ncbi:MAG: hypothetical protein IT561_23205 [Alphaproteobacteria bacterium]|nr:hypothetical protein [Alphaproteobacteria bacterium]
MLFHASLPAADPARTAAAIAELWDGTALPFPPFPGSYIVFADDGRGTALEICPADMALVPGPTAVDAGAADPTAPIGVHVAIGVPHDTAKVLAIAARMGWTARECDRGGYFRVVEVWVDDRLLIEALTPEMQRAYLSQVSSENWRRIFGLPAAA